MITVVTPISAIPSHPDTSILDETVASIRHHLPDAELILTFDGVRPEQQHRTGDYEKFMQSVLWKSDHDPLWHPVCPFIFDEHRHQSGMMRAIIDEIRTPLLMYVEQDTPLVTDQAIDWQTIATFITDGHSNVVRLHHEAQIPEEHGYLIHNAETPLFMRTSQWSQRPHIASTAYYRRILNGHFSEKSRCFIEDRMYGVTVNSYRADGINGWQQHRLHIYTPDGANIKRSYHTDGRAGESKYDDTQVW